VTDVEIESVPPAVAQPAQVPQNAKAHAGAKELAGLPEETEQLLRRFGPQDPSKSLMLNHGLRPGAEVPQIGETYPVNTCRVAARPPAPNQPRNVKQIGWWVSHLGRSKALVSSAPVALITAGAKSGGDAGRGGVQITLDQRVQSPLAKVASALSGQS
jgi:hypothetical protein